MIRRFPNGETRYVEDISSNKKQTWRTETSKYPEEKKTNSDFLSSGERKGTSPNRLCFGKIGVVGLRYQFIFEVEHFGKFDQRG